MSAVAAASSGVGSSCRRSPASVFGVVVTQLPSKQLSGVRVLQGAPGVVGSMVGQLAVNQSLRHRRFDSFTAHKIIHIPS